MIIHIGLVGHSFADSWLQLIKKDIKFLERGFHLNTMESWNLKGKNIG